MNPLLMPVVAAQGYLVRSRTEVVPPAGGPTTGEVVPDGGGTGAPLRIAIVGESTAAGCGVDNHDDGVPGALSRELSERTGRRVEWSVAGQHAATARRIRYKLLPTIGSELDVAVVLAGVNDVLSRRDPQAWRDDVTAIVDDLGQRAGRVAVTGIPPFDIFPSMPGVLGRYLAERARMLDEVARQVCKEHPRAVWVDATSLLPVGPEFFARDHFHPSAVGYRRWSGIIADHVTP
ncbi:SGNH/GDSL hydrolase family protein [Micromonospora sp. NPDC048898]|uniref:SGNH/GDSL hydrolase family protein n=1 Tax=Micromonospora sp. NPDC048898 TaxID=3364260 RepID=UPI003711BB7D